jgi:hypothetical protein
VVGNVDSWTLPPHILTLQVWAEVKEFAFFFFLAVLEIKPWSLHKLNKHFRLSYLSSQEFAF